MGYAFLFPGQGAQFAGMGADLYEKYSSVKEIYDKANEIVGYELSKLCFEGPAEKLNATDIQQPAIFVTSVAALTAMRESEKYKGVKADYAAGLSLGEYTAYYAADAFDFASALKLVQARGRFMQAAANASDGAMISVIGLDDEKVLKICDKARENDILVAANFNCPGQVVISGSKTACNRATELAEQEGAMKVVTLDVAGAFHSPLMAPAAEQLKAMLYETEIKTPKIPVIANVDCQSHNDPDDIRESLAKQLTSSTYWSKTMSNLIEAGVDKFIEIGPKRTLCGFLKRINRKLRPENIGTAADLE